ncbi:MULTISPECIES: winged helix-turn-helix domain-containing protein [Sutcliffiella]|uniref:Transcriptional regulator n=1 Tax=Sutcliffiella cohnii TaxID=33932 RepID=A0A223KLK4_9BACI|nr:MULTISPECIES: helix-turn-helix domain-containing protein [Sutcliffiella]AST90361.1 transcriptional regulator [Sutcliffiella cohnii]WBL16014.1 helix-turn-helix domain-containing protein [Sutcliffiella sp. NC1]
MNDNSLNVSVEQAKLLGNALRIKIIGQLIDKPKTSKQVADLLRETGGNVHYHMKKLYEGGLIELVEERKFGGVIEKYYKSKAKWFNSVGDTQVDPVLKDNYLSKDSTALSLRLHLTPQQQDEIKEEFKQFLENWVMKTSVSDGTQTEEYSIGVKIVSTELKSEEYGD